MIKDQAHNGGNACPGKSTKPCNLSPCPDIKGGIMSEDIGGFLPLPKNIPKNYFKLSYPVHGNDKVLVGFSRLYVRNITVIK